MQLLSKLVMAAGALALTVGIAHAQTPKKGGTLNFAVVAEPPTLERYIYQFRIGPTADSIRRLVAMLPEERRERWAGKVSDYA